MRLWLLLACVMCSVIGCSSSADPVTRTYQVRTLFNSALQEAITLHDAGVIDKQKMREIEVTARLVDVALTSAEANIDNASWETRFNEVNSLLESLILTLNERRRYGATAPVEGSP